jgi:hypothetical protein
MISLATQAGQQLSNTRRTPAIDGALPFAASKAAALITPPVPSALQNDDADV